MYPNIVTHDAEVRMPMQSQHGHHDIVLIKKLLKMTITQETYG